VVPVVAQGAPLRSNYKNVNNWVYYERTAAT
jgi:hypothetical protein